MRQLSDNADNWNPENDTSGMAPPHELCTCPPGGTLWERLREIEERMSDEPDSGVTTLIHRARCGNASAKPFTCTIGG